jgi:receptor protein-tyrosine kinase
MLVIRRAEGRDLETIQYLRALARSWFIVIITLLAGGAGGYFVYHEATPLYRSSVRMIVSGDGGGQSTDEVTARILATQRALALSQVAGTAPAIKAAAAAAGYPGSAPAVSSASDDQGPFLTVTVVDTNAARAQAIADAYARILPATLVALEGRADTAISVANLAPASLPAAPYSPKLIPDLGLGLAAGLILGIAIALLREAVDRTVRDTDELERISELSAVGTVPRGLPKHPLPVNTRPRSARAEAYRQVRTTLLNAESRPRAIAITSASAWEGKTSVAANVAAVFSRAGHHVALVDADLRRPRVATVFGVRSKPGLSDVLARRVSLDDALIQLDDGRLAILPSGTIPANPSEALGGAVMEEVLERLKAQYEYVFIDTPPVLPVTDALVVAPMVDGVVLVTRLGRTTRERVRRAQAAIGRVNATIIGVVPNHAGKGADRDYRYGYKYAGSHKKGDKPADIDADTLLATAPAAGEAPAEAPAAESRPHTTQFREPPAVGGGFPSESGPNGAPKDEAPLDEPYSAPGWSGS